MLITAAEVIAALQLMKAFLQNEPTAVEKLKLVGLVVEDALSEKFRNWEPPPEWDSTTGWPGEVEGGQGI